MESSCLRSKHPGLALVRLTCVVCSPAPQNQTLWLGGGCDRVTGPGRAEGGSVSGLVVCSPSHGAPRAAAAATPSAERPEPLGSLTRRGGQAVTHLPPGR